MADGSLLRSIGGFLLDRDTCPARTRALLSALVLAAFAALVITGALHHEIWRDEMRALTIAREADGVLDLPRALANEGHPMLWYVVLRAAHAIAPTPVVLKFVAAAIGVAGAAVLFLRAPLPTWWRTLFVFGWVPLYGCSVLCRNYGTGVLLLLWFCTCASGTKFRPLCAAIALTLLANSYAYGTMAAVGLAPFFVVEAVRRRVAARTIVLGVLLIAAGVVLAAWTMAPTPESKVVPSPGSRFADPLYTALRAAWSFGFSTEPLFGWMPVAWGFLLLVVLATLAVPHLCVAVIGVCAVAALFMHAIYNVSYRHLSMLYAFLAAVTWLRAATPAAVRAPARLASAGWRALLFGAWPLVLVLQAWRGVREVKIDVESLLTAAPLLAQVLDRDDLRGAIVVGEPDYFVEALPYYRDNRIFVAREGRFANRVSWTCANQRDLDLGALLATARTLQREHGVPVVLVIGRQFDLRQPSGAGTHGFGDRFRWTAAQQRELTATTEHVASLPPHIEDERGDELYEVYRLRP